MRTSLVGAFFLVIVASLAACQPHRPAPSAPGNAERIQEYDRQMAKVKEQQAVTDQQLKLAEDQQKRMEALVTRWEKQADRYDAVLARWEKQSPAGER